MMYENRFCQNSRALLFTGRIIWQRNDDTAGNLLATVRVREKFISKVDFEIIMMPWQRGSSSVLEQRRVSSWSSYNHRNCHNRRTFVVYTHIIRTYGETTTIATATERRARCHQDQGPFGPGSADARACIKGDRAPIII